MTAPSDGRFFPRPPQAAQAPPPAHAPGHMTGRITGRMTGRMTGRAAERVTGPFGAPMTRADLPPPDTRRWVTRRKAEVVAGVRQGLITLPEACERYGLTVDEFMSWQKRFESHGIEGLRATRVVELRREDRRFTGEWAEKGAA